MNASKWVRMNECVCALVNSYLYRCERVTHCGLEDLLLLFSMEGRGGCITAKIALGKNDTQKKHITSMS